ncbi:MAG: hypothetical protein HY940_03150 [Gammaproteobacteria bacterium]|nr:hypothetical protein [Gammaproteobacteria bacterium]
MKVPAKLLAAVRQQSDSSTFLAGVLQRLVRSSYANATGIVGGTTGTSGSFVPVSGITVELVRMVYDPASGAYSEQILPCNGGCPVTAVDGTFTLSTLQQPSSDIALKVTFIDVNSQQVIMRSPLYGSSVDINPVSEAVTQLITPVVGGTVPLSNFTPNEIKALVSLVDDETLDVSNLDFNAAIAKIKTEASDVLAKFLAGFQGSGEMHAVRPHDVFHIMESGLQLTAPNLNFTNGAMNLKASLGGGVSFDANANLQSGSAIYFWGLRGLFAGDPLRLFDQALDQLVQDPGIVGYNTFATYGQPIGMEGIIGAVNGNATAYSTTESATPGFITNDGGLMVFLREQDNAGQLVYERGTRILMKKWVKSANNYNELYTNANFFATYDPNGATINRNNNQGNQVSPDLNPIMSAKAYNVVTYQSLIDAAGVEQGAGTSLWSFSNAAPVLLSGGANASTKTFGTVLVSGAGVNAAKYSYGTAAVTVQAKPLDPCPNYYQIQEGGSLMLRRDSLSAACRGLAASVFAGTGGVTADGEVFIVPQIYDDLEDDVTLEFPITGGAGRRGWYIGMQQAVGLMDVNVTGVYHVVGQITDLDAVTKAVTQRSLHGDLQFVPNSGGVPGNNIVSGTVHDKRMVMDQIQVGDAVAASLSKTFSQRSDLSGGSYQVAADGTFTFALPGMTETVTGIAGQVLTLGDGSKVAMLLAIPVVNSTTNGRGLLLLAHEFLVPYPVP